ncbi:MAG: 16S rRNA (cytosine(1402)-N(4))-methyltransferase RsmH [Oligosphaeraceae bacterium]|nr:16S rRNA (cytosine(1402)-N(4))-methyltransferase RsmH [Oligosphaeraceae bacterium]
MTFQHQTVLLDEAVGLLCENGGERFIDGTLGGGGHSERILQLLPQAQVLGIDRDPEALKAAGLRLQGYGERFKTVHGRFSQMHKLAEQIGWQKVNGVLLDVGVSSAQIDNPERGFSFRFDAPLDMRMNPQEGQSAADLLNNLSEQELADILYHYGEERKARRIARAIVERRVSKPWESTGELNALLERIVGRAKQRGLPPATRSFQALRIAVNAELEELELALQKALQLCESGGRIAVICFHSLEDRIVKSFFRHEAAACVCPPGLPICDCGKRASLKLVNKKPLIADEAERQQNPRASSAKLRVAEKL